MEKKMETAIAYWGPLGKMEKKMEATMVYWGYLGRMEKKIEATIAYCGPTDSCRGLRILPLLNALGTPETLNPTLNPKPVAPQRLLSIGFSSSQSGPDSGAGTGAGGAGGRLGSQKSAL